MKERREKDKDARAKNAEKGAGGLAVGKQLRDDDDDGLVSKALVGKRRAFEEAHQSVMRSDSKLPPFDLEMSPKLPFGMEEVFVEGVDEVDFAKMRQKKKEVNLAMH